MENKKRKDAWTEFEDRFIRLFYKKHGDEVAASIGRSVATVRKRACMLGVANRSRKPYKHKKEEVIIEEAPETLEEFRENNLKNIKEMSFRNLESEDVSRAKKRPYYY